MKSIALSTIILGVALMFSACASLEEDLQEAGGKPMTSSEINAVVSDKTERGVNERGTAWVVYYDPSGEIRGNAVWSGGSETDKGTWKVTQDDMLCITFDKWRDGKERCWQLYRVDGELYFIGKKGDVSSKKDDTTWEDGNVENL